MAYNAKKIEKIIDAMEQECSKACQKIMDNYVPIIKAEVKRQLDPKDTLVQSSGVTSVWRTVKNRPNMSKEDYTEKSSNSFSFLAQFSNTLLDETRDRISLFESELNRLSYPMDLSCSIGGVIDNITSGRKLR